MSSSEDAPAPPASQAPVRLTRRRLLALGAGAAVAATGVLRLTGYADAARFGDLARLSPTAGAIMGAVVSAVLAPSADRSAAALEAHVRAVDAYLVGLDDEVVRDVHALLYAVEHLTFMTGPRLSRFSALDDAGRAAVLQGLRASAVGLLRLGLRSLVALVFLAHYRTRETFAPLGYAGPTATPESAPPEARTRYDALLAPPGAEPASS